MKQKLIRNTLQIQFEQNDPYDTVYDYLDLYNQSRKNKYLLCINRKMTLNGITLTQDAPIKPNDKLMIDLSTNEKCDFNPEYFNLHVLYEDDCVLIVDKPSRMIVYPESKKGSNTLYNGVSYYYQCNNLDIPVRAVHRLDKNTTGCILFCKIPFFLPFFDQCLNENRIKRTYLAVVEGNIRSLKGAVRIKIARDRHDARKMRIAEEGKEAVTRYETLKRNKKYSVVQCTLESGRTHQVRLSMLHLKNPILSDELYGNTSPLINRCALHAAEITYVDPITLLSSTIKAPIPNDMKKFFK